LRRLGMLLLAALACALLTSPAEAARIKTKPVGQDKAAVEQYWTSERMQNAIPADPFNAARNQGYSSHGYPAAPPFNGQRLWRCDSPLAYDDNAANPPTMGIDCDMTGGSSGGGWIARRQRVLGELVRVRDAAERHVRAVPGRGRPEPLYAGVG
jgi:hypothetical protein